MGRIRPKTRTPHSAGYWTHRVWNAFHAKIHQRVKPLGLTGAQAITLNLIAQHTPDSIGELARMVGHSVPAIVRQVESLETDGLVSRQPDPDDDRVRNLRLTEEGRRLHPQVLLALRSVQETAMSGLDRDQQRTLFALLRKVHENLED